MAERLVRAGHRVVGFDPKQRARTLWVMVPAGEITDSTVTEPLSPLAARWGYSLAMGGGAPVVECLRSIFDTLGRGSDPGRGRVGSVGAVHLT